ncbi:hypothetical protein [Alteraurantiacibacter aquimixticola]|uniref:Uncharacterized protein n=1 Tax=Alteraurantiacibacter aquimixticola TaxID=2489173 RepID=A0A4T3F2I4_9SPHN|nr:hypothetical protein [Alteraurantiacibacter aquimixticola]TIX49625.1 hypothetical protein E5222_12400 [Alteraurantiacibacter aquimixticola]
MADNVIERMNYFQFQQIGAEDFRIEQSFNREARARHDLGPHSWGIIEGCRIVETPREGDASSVDLKVTPGLAVDGFGRRIAVLETIPVTPELFAAFDSERVIELWLHYDEYTRRTDNDRGAICLGDPAYSRIIESHRLLVGTFIPEHDSLVVEGVEARPALADGSADEGAPILPADVTIAAQDFPEDLPSAFWPIRLGSVRWDGAANRFRPVASPAVLEQGRRYAGFIGGSLLAEGQLLRLAPRVPVLAGPDAEDFATIEGRVQVDGRIIAKKDVLLHGGMLSFQSVGGSDETVPLTMRRVPDAVGSGADLRVQIGDNPASNVARFTVATGVQSYAAETTKVVASFRADHRIDIPNGRLRFPGTARQAIDLGVASDADPSVCGIGWQGSSVYQRSGAAFYWYRDGKHDPTPGDPGTGGSQLMRLSTGGSLYFGNDYRQVINFDMDSGQSFGLGIQNNTLYARSAQHFAWYRGGGPDPAALSPGGGAKAMVLDNTSRLTVEGGITSRGRVELHGVPLDFRMSDGSSDTDVLQIARDNRGGDQNDLQVVIGDNLSGDDRFVVGPRVSGSFQEKFVVANDGTTRVAGDLFARGHNVLIDIVAGEFELNRLSAGSGTQPLELSSSRIANVRDAQIMVALSHIHNEFSANDARWKVSYAPNSRILLGGNRVRFPIAWEVGDSDGHLHTFSYIAIFLA